MRYESYIFDLYGTLVDIHTEENDPVLWEKLALFYGYYDAAYTPAELKKRFRELVTGKEADTHEAFPEIRIEDVFAALFAEKGVDAGKELAVHAGQFFRILSTEYVRVYDGAPELLQRLRDGGAKIYLLSNAQRIFTEYEMHTLGIAQYFDDIFISSEFGVKKPEKRFFELLLQKHDINPSTSVMVGNDMKSDIGGAKSVGLHTCYIHSNISPELIGEPDAEDVLMEMDMRKLGEVLI